MTLGRKLWRRWHALAAFSILLDLLSPIEARRIAKDKRPTKDPGTDHKGCPVATLRPADELRRIFANQTVYVFGDSTIRNVVGPLAMRIVGKDLVLPPFTPCTAPAKIITDHSTEELMVEFTKMGALQELYGGKKINASEYKVLTFDSRFEINFEARGDRFLFRFIWADRPSHFEREILKVKERGDADLVFASMGVWSLSGLPGVPKFNLPRFISQLNSSLHVAKGLFPQGELGCRGVWVRDLVFMAGHGRYARTMSNWGVQIVNRGVKENWKEMGIRDGGVRRVDVYPVTQHRCCQFYDRTHPSMFCNIMAWEAILDQMGDQGCRAAKVPCQPIPRTYLVQMPARVLDFALSLTST